MRECTLITESRVEECGIVAQVVKCAPRVCGDDPTATASVNVTILVLPAYAGMILKDGSSVIKDCTCSPRMRG